MYLWDAVAQRFFKRFERQRLAQLQAEMPRFDHARENIHDHCEVDEASLETHISNICTAIENLDHTPNQDLATITIS